MTQLGFKLNLCKYDEYKNIKNIVLELYEWHRANSICVPQKEIHDGVYKNIKYIEETVTERERDISDKLVNDIKICDEEIIKLTKENKQNILNYIYWKYKNESKDNENKVKVNIFEMKKILLVEPRFKYIKNFYINYTCPICKNTGKIMVDSYDKIHNAKFMCNNCNHSTKRRYQRDMFLFNCECCVCKEKENRFYEIIKKNLNSLILILINEVEEYLKLKVEKDPSDEDMMEDWKCNNKHISNEINKILSVNPVNYNQLIEVVEKISKDKKDYNRIIEEMIDKKVIYNSFNSYGIKEIKEYIINSIDINGIYGYYINDLDYNMDFIDKCNDDIILKNKIKLYNNSYHLVYDDEEFLMRFDSDIIYFNLSIFERSEVVLNKYFFKINDNLVSKNKFFKIENLLKLKEIIKVDEENNNSKVIYCNYEVRKIIDIENLNDKFTEDVLDYLKNVACLDYLICNSDGSIKAILTKDNLYKDDMTIMIKAVLSIADIPYEEI